MKNKTSRGARRELRQAGRHHGVEQVWCRIRVGKDLSRLFATCMDGARRSTMDELAAATMAATKVLAF